MVALRFNKLLQKSRLFELQHTKLIENNTINEKVLNLLINYFIAYVEYFDLSDELISDKHMEFLNEYKIHLREFEKHGMYPYENNDYSWKKRIDYDIPLLCSTFLAYHRYLIFETLYEKINATDDESILVIGVGCGIELKIVNDKCKNIFAYDLEIGEFIKTAFPSVNFTEKHFCYEPEKSFDKIILIELLEHLEHYKHLLVEVMRALKPSGRIHFTTAVNIPQFDHLHNFELNDKDLESCILNNGFEIEYKLDLPHNYKVNVVAYNCYYIIKKTNNDF
jgi:SAM-dependent methyltransferase